MSVYEYNRMFQFKQARDYAPASRTALVIGAAAMPTAGFHTGMYPFVWRQQGPLRYAYVPLPGRQYIDPLFMRAVILFVKELRDRYTG